MVKEVTIPYTEPERIPLPIMRALVEIYYDFQKQRIATFNNILMNCERNGISQEDLEEKYQVTPLIDEAKKFENRIKARLASEVQKYPIYTKYLQKIQGIGVVISAGLIANIGEIEHFNTISKLWMYAGLGFNRYCPECEHPTFVEVTYEDRNGHKKKTKRLKPFNNCPECGNETEPIIQKRTTGYQSNWSSKLKVLAWKLGQSFVKQDADKSGYRRIYEQFRFTDRGFHPEKIVTKGKTTYNDGHIYNRAVRKTAKIFLSHLWITWRTMEKLPVREPYVEKVLGHDIIKPFVDKK